MESECKTWVWLMGFGKVLTAKSGIEVNRCMEAIEQRKRAAN